MLRDVARVLRPGAPLAITFSNRCFPTKAVAAWHQRDDRGRAELIASYLRDAGAWTGIEALDRIRAAATRCSRWSPGRSIPCRRGRHRFHRGRRRRQHEQKRVKRRAR